jgi:hypothetical protein
MKFFSCCKVLAKGERGVVKRERGNSFSLRCSLSLSFFLNAKDAEDAKKAQSIIALLFAKTLRSPRSLRLKLSVDII